jgi:drug/metabolite transporter (DMT)-like permease
VAVLGVLFLVERASWKLPLGALVVLAGVVVAQAAYVRCASTWVHGGSAVPVQHYSV